MSSNNENTNTPNTLACIYAITPDFGVSPVSSLSENLCSNLNIRRNLAFISNNEGASTNEESDGNASTNSCSSTIRMIKYSSKSSAGGGGSGGGGGAGSPSNGGTRFSFAPTDKENSGLSYTIADYSSMSDCEVSPSKFAITKQMCVAAAARERYPLEDQDPNSQDSGYSNSSSTFSDDSKSSTTFRFAEPNGVAPRRTTSTDSPGRDGNSPLTKRLAMSPRYRKQPLQHRTSTDSTSSDLSDDGFGENFMLPSDGSLMQQNENARLPTDFSTLLSGTIYNQSPFTASSGATTNATATTTGDQLSFPRGLRRSLTENATPSRTIVRSSVESDLDELVLMESTDLPLKRTASDEESGVFLKRRKACTQLTCATSVYSAFPPKVVVSSSNADSVQQQQQQQQPPPPLTTTTTTTTGVLRRTLFDYGFRKTSVRFQRSFSESAATIAKAIEQSTLNPNLIGDCSRPFALPLKMGKHADQRNIDCHTLARLIRGDYDDKVASFTIIDCRYPYEYDAGHIKGAINIHTPEKIKDELFVKKSLRNFHQFNDPRKHSILIFHCEFSSERGPSLSRYLRKVDRDHYGVQFPKLDYPEVYLLDGGYSEFYRHYKELCDPCFYQRMIDSRYANEMSQGNKERTMFSRSKSWATTDDSSQSKPRNTTFKRLVL